MNILYQIKVECVELCRIAFFDFKILALRLLKNV